MDLPMWGSHRGLHRERQVTYRQGQDESHSAVIFSMKNQFKVFSGLMVIDLSMGATAGTCLDCFTNNEEDWMHTKRVSIP